MNSGLTNNHSDEILVHLKELLNYLRRRT